MELGSYNDIQHRLKFPTMKKLLSIAIAVLILQACSKPAEPVAGPAAKSADHANASTVAWVKPDGSNMDKIFADAKAANKPVFLYWGAVWCPPCNQVKATVFNRPDFIARSQNVIPVYLDGDTPGAQKIGAQFKVRGYPTMIVMRPDRTELTRLPGEVDAQRYLEALDMAVTSGRSVRDALQAVQSTDPTKASSQAWRQLAYYAWDQDEAQIVAAKDKARVLHQLATSVPGDQSGIAARLTLKAIVASVQDKSTLPDGAQLLRRAQQIVADTTLARESFDVLVNYSSDIVGAVSKAGSSERTALLTQFNSLLDQLAVDASLSTADRLGAVYSKVALAKMDLAPGAVFKPEAALLTQARAAAATADKTVTSNYERQAVIPSAADLLSEVGLLDESDALLKAELPGAISPYYHMLVLSGNAKLRGDKLEAINWSEKAWNESKGPATRLQWGIGYISLTIDLSPKNSVRIEKAVTDVLAELEATPDTFYERNRRGLEKLGVKLHTWNAKGDYTPVVKKVTAQLDAVCVKLPEGDEARTACSGAFKKKPVSVKA
jgi:thioredoxin-related protein